jgi:hypothetical protein
MSQTAGEVAIPEQVICPATKFLNSCQMGHALVCFGIVWKNNDTSVE